MTRVTPSIGIATVCLILACGGGIDTDSLYQLDEALEMVSPQIIPTLFIVGGAEAGLLKSSCGDELSKAAEAPPHMQQMLFSQALFRTCPKSCAQGVASTIASLPPTERMKVIVPACGEGPFAGKLAPLRDAAPALEYLAVRTLLDKAIKAQPSFVKHAEKLALGMAIDGGDLYDDTTSELVVSSSRPIDTAPFKALGPAITACDEPELRHRVIFSADGKAANVVGSSCVSKLLKSVKLAGDGDWLVVDLLWKPETKVIPTP